MNVTAPVQSSSTRVGVVPAPLGLAAAAGATAALVATYWDDSWHTDKGRDEFAIPPHLLLYGGVLVASLAVAAWGVLSWRAAGWGLAGLRSVLSRPALLLAGIGGTATLASGPIDAAWHEAYGRDAVLWSPPHLAAVAGTLALSVGLLAGLRLSKGRGAATARAFAAAGVIGALQVPVLEYDSDVPQFSTFWFLPVAALGLCVAAALLDDLLPNRSAIVVAAVVYTVLRALTVGFLASAGFSLTSVPPVLPLLLLYAALWNRALPIRLVVLGAAAPPVWWPAQEAQASVTTVVPVSQLPAAVLLAALAGLVVAVARGDVRWRTSGVATPLVAVAILSWVFTATATPAPAWAHDPGQGVEQQEGQLTVRRAGATADLIMLLHGPCAGLTAQGTTARRAGRVLRGPLTATESSGRCRLEGSVAGLGEGRWFVYAEARDPAGRLLEAWLPVAGGRTASETRPLYLPPVGDGGAGRTLAGGALLLVVALLLAGSLRLARRTAAEP